MKNAVQKLTILVFLLGISLPAVLFLFGMRNKPEQENFAPLPKFGPRTADDYLKRAGALFSNRFPGRNLLLQKYSDLKVNLDISPLPDKVVMGKDGWLYLGNSSVQVLYSDLGLNYFSTLQTTEIDSAVAYHKKLVESYGIPYLWVIAPNKHQVYPEYLPGIMGEIHRQNRIAHWLAQSTLKPNQRPLVLAQDILAHKEGDQLLYLKKDTHWNVLGGWYGFEAIMKELKTKFTDLKIFNLDKYNLSKTDTAKAGLYRMLGQGHYAPEHNYPFMLEPANSRYFSASYYKRNNTYLTTHNGEAPNQLKVLLITDSFGAGMQHYFSDHFREVSFLNAYAIDPTIIEKEKPDVVIQVVVARALYTFARERP